jgi:hypothetical protein
MPNDNRRDLSHIHLHNQGQQARFTWPAGGGTPMRLPSRDRDHHADHLKRSLKNAMAAAQKQQSTRDADISGGASGYYLEFEIGKDQRQAIDSLEDMRGKEHIELLAVRPSESDPENALSATVFVPESKGAAYDKKIDQYRNEETKGGNPRNRPLIESINDVKLATARSFFTDAHDRFPDDGQSIWWEVWIRSGTREIFAHAAAVLNIASREHSIAFAEREVVLALATPEQIGTIIANTDSIAELRSSQDTPSFFQRLDILEQKEWTEEMADRLEPPEAGAPAVCLMDSGSTRIHPLIEPVLNDADFQSWDAILPPHDNSALWQGHGTKMSGLAIYGDLTEALISTDAVEISHVLESVKILPDRGANHPDLYGHITSTAMSRAEIQAPERARVFCLAVTDDADRWHGKPSSWSASMDRMAFGVGEDQRLIAVSAGNIRFFYPESEYLDQNDASPVEDPAQAWNVVTVGAFTEKLTIEDESFEDWKPVAPVGDISPLSRTSIAWQDQWPIKPDVVFEGGNYAVAPDDDAIDEVDDLLLLTTNNRLQDGYFNVIADTSAASALAARMSAQILADNQDLWPETVRALLVHSANWTNAMQSHLPARPTQGDKRQLLRRYGYGVPDLAKATRSSAHDVTLVIEDSIQPFFLEGSNIKTRDMNYHALPWPQNTLESLANTSVELKVTLSYFVEPNPGERGWTKKHRYASHGLRFAVKRPLETDDDFRKRINGAARDEGGAQNIVGNDDGWFFGPNLQTRGSIHSDTWSGTAAELAGRGSLAVYPIGGWWKEKKRLERYENHARYSLILTLRAAEGVDIYAEIVNSVGVGVEIDS